MSEVKLTEFDQRYWVVLRKPGNVPERKGPFRRSYLLDFLREVMRHRRGEFVEVIWIAYGELVVEDGGQYLQIADGRSSPLVRKHRASLPGRLALEKEGGE